MPPCCSSPAARAASMPLAQPGSCKPSSATRPERTSSPTKTGAPYPRCSGHTSTPTAGSASTWTAVSTSEPPCNDHEGVPPEHGRIGPHPWSLVVRLVGFGFGVEDLADLIRGAGEVLADEVEEAGDVFE